LVYMTTTDQMISIGGNYYGGNGNQNIWTLNMNSMVASCAPNCVPIWTHLGLPTSDSGPGEGWVAWWNNISNQPQFIDDTYNLETMTMPLGPWTNNTTNLSIPGYDATAVFDESDQLVFYAGCGESCQAFWVSLSAGSSYTQNVITLGASCGSILTGYPMMAWDPIDRAIRVLPNGSNTQYLISPNTASSTWNCTTETYGSTQGTNYPPAMNTSMRGVYGRFNYFADWDVFVLCNDATQDCWYLKPNR
jgi:hypothetical protein